MDSIDDIQRALKVAETSSGLVRQIDDILNIFRPYKPEIRKFRIDYTEKSSEIKYLLQMPSGIRRQTHRTVELPARIGFRIDEVLDLDTTEMLDIDFDTTGNKWIVNTSKFTGSERFLVTLKGNVSDHLLKRLVSVDCASNPTFREEEDFYWIHSALKDVSILEKLWHELNIDRVHMDVRIGVDRFFSSAIPKDISARFEAQAKLLNAIASGQRNIQNLQLDYRRRRRQSRISAAELVDIFTKMVSGEFFRNYIQVDEPFNVGTIEPFRQFTSLVPERVKVGVRTNLDFKMPAVKGNLRFKRKRYEESVTEMIDEYK